jgi:DEAD/DEAH box helicase domain-containing protein
VSPEIVEAYRTRGVTRPWEHQVTAAESVHAGSHTIVATGTASGKSLAYLMPSLDSVIRGGVLPDGTRTAGRGDATVLYLSPTKALAADQLESVIGLDLPGVRAATFDGDTPREERRWVREYANVVFTNPDMLHFGLLPQHSRWAGFLRRLTHVIVDEAHGYRGVFGSHVAVLLRRLRRVAAHYGSAPVFVGASATSASPAESFSRLIGAPARAVTEDASAKGERTVALWEPPLTGLRGENGAEQRRTVIAETSELLANLVCGQVRTLAFIRSRRGAEAISTTAARLVGEVDPSLPQRIAAYRSGYLPEERRAIEAQLRNGDLLGVSSTSALELGIDVDGLDAVLVAGWPGTRASFFQQIGRAGRSGKEALATFVAADDPLDTYLVHHPEAVFDVGVEATVTDPSNPYVLGPHLMAAASELPLRPDDLDLFGPTAVELVDELVSDGALRRRPAGWFWTHPQSAHELVDLRSAGGGPVSVVDVDSGTVLGSMDSPQTHYQAHTGAIYVHQGRTYLVEELDEVNHTVLVSATRPEYYTQARDLTTVEVVETEQSETWGEIGVHFGKVVVTTQVVSFQRKALYSNEVLGEEPLDLEPRQLFTKAVWFTIPEPRLHAAGLTAESIPGSLHAAEHASIGMLPLVASSDRWDVGGVSTALHADTGMPTIFVHDGHPGGAGFAERGHAMAPHWLAATRDAVMACECSSGCPSCVQSPKCGNRNHPLDKAGAVALLGEILRLVPAERRRR